MRCCSGYCLVVPHEELGVLLEDVFRDLAGDVDNGGVVTFAPGFLEASADCLKAEHLETLLL